MLLTTTLAVHTDLPAMEKYRNGTSVKPMAHEGYVQAHVNDRLNGGGSSGLERKTAVNGPLNDAAAEMYDLKVCCTF